MIKVFGEIPTAYFETLEEAEQYRDEWQEGSETELYIVIAK